MTVEELLEGVVLPIDKPYQWTSFQAVNKVKSYIRHRFGLKKFKIGHAGTLDPLATGLLLVCIGKATKSIDTLQQGEKIYTGTMVLGATTPCYDLERAIDRYYPFVQINPTMLEQTRQMFLGDIQQVPPMFSAVKIDGQRAYEYARLDDPTVTIAPKTVHVESFEITAFREGHPDEPLPELMSIDDTRQRNLYDNPLGSIPIALPQLDFSILCGKGTYIRSLARDFGAALDSGAFLSALRRERIGDYSISQAVALDQLDGFFS